MAPRLEFFQTAPLIPNISSMHHQHINQMCYWMNGPISLSCLLCTRLQAAVLHTGPTGLPAALSLSVLFTSNQSRQMAALHSPALLEVSSHCSGGMCLSFDCGKKSPLKMQVDVIWLTVNKRWLTEKSPESLCLQFYTKRLQTRTSPSVNWTCDYDAGTTCAKV